MLIFISIPILMIRWVNSSACSSFRRLKPPVLIGALVRTLLVPPLLASVAVLAQTPEQIRFGTDDIWYLQGEIKPVLILDTHHNDPNIQARRTEVFGDDGRNDPAQGTDNSCIPSNLNNADGTVADCNKIGLDLPVFGGTILGSRTAIGVQGDDFDAFLELAFANPLAPYDLSLHRIWSEYRGVGLGLGWSGFMDFKKDERNGEFGFFPYTLDYPAPPSVAHNRHFVLRTRLGNNWYLSLEEGNYDIYLGYPFLNTNNGEDIYAKDRLALTDSQNNVRTYDITRSLISRDTIPDIIFTYYGKSVFFSLLMQYVTLDTNSPVPLREDEGLNQLLRDATNNAGGAVLTEIDKRLNLISDIRGMSKFNLGLNLGFAGPMGRNSVYRLAYIYNGGRYLSDNPNPSHLVVSKNLGCTDSCDYELVNIATHSYLVNFNFNQRYNLIFSGSVTADDYGIQLGGAATKQIHTTYFNYQQPFNRLSNLKSVYEITYSYRQTFNTRHNSSYPRFRFGYGLVYTF